MYEKSLIFLLKMNKIPIMSFAQNMNFVTIRPWNVNELYGMSSFQTDIRSVKFLDIKVNQLSKNVSPITFLFHSTTTEYNFPAF